MVRANTWIAILAVIVGLPTSPGLANSLTEELGGDELIRAARKEGKVVVYTTNTLAQAKVLQLSFNSRFPDIHVELVRLGGGALHSRIMTEHAAGKLVADVLEYSDRGLIRRALEAGIIADFRPPTDGRYPANTKIPGKVYPGSSYLYLIAYNPALVKEPPRGWIDLVHPRFKGKIGIVSAGAGGASWMLALFQYQVLGQNSDSYWRKLAGQGPRFFTSASGIGQTLISGETPVGVILDVVSVSDIRRGAPVKFVYPPEGVVMVVFNHSITTGAKNPNAAKLWLNWVLSREGQEVWTKQIGGLSARIDIEPPETAPRKVTMWTAAEDDYVKLRDSYVKQWNEIFGYKP